MVHTPAVPLRLAAQSPRADAAVPSSQNVVWVLVCEGLGLALGLWIAATQGSEAAAEYYAAYLLEKSLSVDNIFVFVIIIGLVLVATIAASVWHTRTAAPAYSEDYWDDAHRFGHIEPDRMVLS